MWFGDNKFQVKAVEDTQHLTYTHTHTDREREPQNWRNILRVKVFFISLFILFFQFSLERIARARVCVCIHICVCVKQSEKESERALFHRSSSFLEQPVAYVKIHLSEFELTEFVIDSEPTSEMKMRIKRDSPCLVLRFMPLGKLKWSW